MSLNLKCFVLVLSQSLTGWHEILDNSPASAYHVQVLRLWYEPNTQLQIERSLEPLKSLPRGRTLQYPTSYSRCFPQDVAQKIQAWGKFQASQGYLTRSCLKIK